MRLPTLLLVLLLQCASIGELSGLTFCTHADGNVLLETVASLCCNQCVLLQSPAKFSLSDGDECQDRSISLGGPQLLPSKDQLGSFGIDSLALESGPPAGELLHPASFVPVRCAPGSGPSIAGYALTCARIVAPRC